MNNLKVATVGNPGMHMPTLLGALPGMSSFATAMMKKEIERIDIPPVGEFITMIHDAGCEIYACRATVDMFHLKPTNTSHRRANSSGPAVQFVSRGRHGTADWRKATRARAISRVHACSCAVVDPPEHLRIENSQTHTATICGDRQLRRSRWS
jgi:hypothetical protein